MVLGDSYCEWDKDGMSARVAYFFRSTIARSLAKVHSTSRT